MRRLTMTLVAIATLVTVAAVGAFATGCGGNSVPSDAVATVGGVSVTKADFQQLLTQAQAQMKASGMTMPAKGSATYDHYVAQIVAYLIQEKVIAQSTNSWQSPSPTKKSTIRSRRSRSLTAARRSSRCSSSKG